MQKNQLRWGRKHFLKLGRKKSCQNISSTSFVWSKKSIINEFTFDFTYFFLQKKGTSKNCTNIYSHLSIILGTSLQQFFGDQYIHILCWPTPHTAPYILANHAKWYLCWNDPKNQPNLRCHIKYLLQLEYGVYFLYQLFGSCNSVCPGKICMFMWFPGIR